MWHLGEVHWFWGTIADRQLDDPGDAERDKPERPAGYEDLVVFGRSSLDRLIAVLDRSDDSTPVWTWAHRKDVGFIRRHQVQETCVHRWDLQQAAGRPPDAIDPEAASDSIDEFLSISLPWSVNADRPLDGTVDLQCTDTSGEWLIHGEGRVEPVHAKGDAAVRATASNLLLALYERVTVDELELIGDEALARHLFDMIDVG